MRYRSLISVVSLLAFLPVAAGCANHTTSFIQDDLVTDETTAKLADGDEVWISGYTTRIGGYHRWRGHVSYVGADSLEFLRSDPTTNSSRETEGARFRLARADVISLEVATSDDVATTALLMSSVAMVLVFALAKGISDAFDEDNWFQGTR